jgi:hypothetical protein
MCNNYETWLHQKLKPVAYHSLSYFLSIKNSHKLGYPCLSRNMASVNFWYFWYFWANPSGIPPFTSISRVFPPRYQTRSGNPPQTDQSSLPKAPGFRLFAQIFQNNFRRHCDLNMFPNFSGRILPDFRGQTMIFLLHQGFCLAGDGNNFNMQKALKMTSIVPKCAMLPLLGPSSRGITPQPYGWSQQSNPIFQWVASQTCMRLTSHETIFRENHTQACYFLGIIVTPQKNGRGVSKMFVQWYLPSGNLT